MRGGRSVFGASKLAEHQFRGRREDLRLLTGRGKYTTDHHASGQVAAHFLRADRAHAKILTVDTAEARKLPGVLDIMTGADIVAMGWKTPPVLSFFKGVGGSSVRIPFRPGLANGRVRFVGEPVAVVIAATDHLAQDAAERIQIEYEDLPVVVDAGEALAASAVRVHEEMPDNLSFEYEYGDRVAAEHAFAKAAHVIRVAVTAQRIAGNPMEPKSCIARYDAASDAFDLYLPSQGTSDLKTALAQITGLGAEKFRIHSMDVGGGFGVRNEIYPECLAVLLAAKRTGKAVRWTGTRSETISGDHHARAAEPKGRTGARRQGKVSRPARRMAGESRRLLLRRRRAHQHRRGADQLGHQPLQGACLLRPAPARLHQHDARHRLSRRGTAQRRVSVGAPGRRGGPHARDRFGPAAPAQHSRQDRVPNENAHGPHL